MITWETIELAIHTWVTAASGLAGTNVIWADQNMQRPAGQYIALRILGIRTIGFDWIDVEDKPLVLADDVVESVDTVGNTLTLTAHAYLTGDGPVQFTTSGTLPAAAGGGLAIATDYWLIKSAANTVKVARTFADAINLVAVDLTSAGTGTHTIVDTPDTRRAGQEIANKLRGQRLVTLSMQCFAGNATGSSSPRAVLHNVVTKLGLPSIGDAVGDAGIGISDVGDVRTVPGAVVQTARIEPRATVEVTFFLANEVEDYSTYIERVRVTDQVPNPDEIFDID